MTGRKIPMPKMILAGCVVSANRELCLLAVTVDYNWCQSKDLKRPQRYGTSMASLDVCTAHAN